MRRILGGAVVLAAAATMIAAGVTVASADDSQPLASSSLVVNEVATSGPNGELDEFVEIVNVSSQTVKLAQNFQVRIYNAQNAQYKTILFPANTVLQPSGSVQSVIVLTGPDFSGTIQRGVQVVPYVLDLPAGIPDDGAVLISTNNNARVDGVAFSASVPAIAREGQPARATANLPVVDPTRYVSAARDVLSTDTDDNMLDFSLHTATPGDLN
ncbi:hypothetical protein GCM10022243_30930 [Saccharothrix violaceirubra]|uniref:LTD domain-containing protein n=1 Tax=Saccharothrix violaceirubra TaxID=413306 RepID=A0A7W7T515_9PSEU|nr:lamin tail domain-containing protein [Saccharothrix violaceirubra]MBB4966718.1 hypothetical protein [Saccharothrix violaceirubra]